MKKIVQVIPALPPKINGVGDYALNLARQFCTNYSLKTHFLVGDLTWIGATCIEEFPITHVSECSASNLLSLLPIDRNATVLLHYVGYGYAKRGCPTWLIDGLQQWRTASSHRSLVTMFHEIYASGPPWTSAFWLSRQQKHLASRLAQLSDRCLTSTRLYAEILQQLSRGKHNQIATLPVFSTIGEPEHVSPLANRTRQLVVFGGRGKRLQVYRKSLAELSQTCELLEIQKILDIGPSTDLDLSSLTSVPVITMGQISASEICAVLSSSFAGFLNYKPEYLAKSSIFAAYCAHGLIPVNAQSSTLPIDGIEAGTHYFVPNYRAKILKGLEEMQAITDNAYTWYQAHNLSAQSKFFTTYLLENLANTKTNNVAIF